MHLALDRDIRVGNTGSKQLTQGAQEERHGGSDPPLLLNGILHLLEQSVLQDGVDHQDQRRHHTGEQGLGALVLEERREGSQGRRLLGGCTARQSLTLLVVRRLPGSHPRVDHPNGVRQDDRGRTSDGAGDHTLHSGEFLGGTPGLDRRGLEEGAGPFVPVVVDEVGHTDAEEGGGEARVEARDSLAGDDLLDGGEEARVCALGFDLGAGREGYQGVAIFGGGRMLAFFSFFPRL